MADGNKKTGPIIGTSLLKVLVSISAIAAY